MYATQPAEAAYEFNIELDEAQRKLKNTTCGVRISKWFLRKWWRHMGNFVSFVIIAIGYMIHGYFIGLSQISGVYIKVCLYAILTTIVVELLLSVSSMIRLYKYIVFDDRSPSAKNIATAEVTELFKSIFKKWLLHYNIYRIQHIFTPSGRTASDIISTIQSNYYDRITNIVISDDINNDTITLI